MAQRLTIGEDSRWVLSFVEQDHLAVRLCSDDEVAEWPELVPKEA